MINLIEKFIQDMSQEKVSIINARNSDLREIYFFEGKDSVLCIAKEDNKVLYNIGYNNIQINILSPNEFSFNVNGEYLGLRVEPGDSKKKTIN